MQRDGASSARVVAIHVPDLPLQRVRRGREAPWPSGGEPAPLLQAQGDRGVAEGPLAIVAEGRVVCCDDAARAAGVRAGAPIAEGLAACGRLLAVPLDPAAERGALRALAEVMLALAPAVELSAPDVLLLDASAAHLLAGGRRAPASGGQPSALPGEEELARRALQAASEMGYAARAAIATGRGPARALVCHAHPAGRAIVSVPPAATAAALASLPLEALGLPPDVGARLARLGVRDAGALARLPPGTLAHRFGAVGVRAARLARGEDDSPLVAYVPETLPEEALELEAPAETADPLLFGLKRLADRVAARLVGRGLGATRLRVVLALDPRGEERIVAPLAAPTASAARWLLPLKEHLFSLRLPGAVVGLRLAAIEVAPLAPEQLSIGDRPEAVAALDGVLARLAVRLGEGAMFAAEPVERYRPELAYRPVPFRPDRARGPEIRAGEVPVRPTRLLAVPAPVVAEGEGGRLTAIRVDGRARNVLALDGPERIRGEWWASPFDRDYYRVRLESLGACWVYRDGGDGRLYLHGFFD